MAKRFYSIVTSGALLASVFSIAPAAAQDPQPAIPATVQIEDPFGDANYLQNHTVTPADAGSISDIGKGWFTNDAEFLYVNLQTEAPPNSNMVGLFFEIQASEDGCLWIDAYVSGATYQSATTGTVQDYCNEIEVAEVEYTFGPGSDGTGLMTWKIPRSYSALFVDGSVLTEPFAESFHLWGGDIFGGYLIAQRIDNTLIGTDYTIAAEPQPEPKKKIKKKKKRG
ncbi:MAG: hypothetical protein LC808_39865 [Actinobacteria bacterium]|nr:hypothetical protein [Actinomycetota bacterium]